MSRRRCASALMSGCTQLLIINGKDYDWTGPAIGERIDLSVLKGRGGKAAAGGGAGELLLAALVDPQCAAAEAAGDQLRMVREGMRDERIRHLLISFNKRQRADKFFSYADSLSLDARACLWHSERALPEALFKMIAPSHLLLNARGEVLGKWPGADPRAEVRALMADATVHDARQIVETVTP